LKKSLLDTDTIINFFKKDINTLKNATLYLAEFNSFIISEINYFEFRKGIEYKGSEKQKIAFEQFVDEIEVLNISRNTVKISASIYSDLRKKGVTIGSSDLLIAGIAIHSDLQLITNNTAHFAQIQGLSLHNWK